MKPLAKADCSKCEFRASCGGTSEHHFALMHVNHVRPKSAIDGTDIVARLRSVHEPNRARAIVRPPGLWLAALARCAFSRKTYDLVFEAVRADLVHEWYEAEVAGRRWQARLIKYVRGPWTMISHMVLQIPVSLGKAVVRIVKAVM